MGKEMFTQNGLTEEQEREILKRDREATKQYATGELKVKTGIVFLKELKL